MALRAVNMVTDDDDDFGCPPGVLVDGKAVFFQTDIT